MKYIITGVVTPERASVSFNDVYFKLADGYVKACCDSSQLTIVVDVQSTDGWISAYVMAKHLAMIVVGSLGFSIGAGYGVHLIQVIDGNDAPIVVGVKLDLSSTPSLEFSDQQDIFNKSLELAAGNMFFRIALRDYTRAITDEEDCPTHCYRAVESIMSSFAFEAHLSKAWDVMHKALGTTRSEIDGCIKKFADPVRHGNWVNVNHTSSDERWKMLNLTREILCKFIDYKNIEQI